MRNGKTVWRWLGVISGFFILTATAKNLPPPDDREYSAKELAAERIQLAGKIIKVKFNRIYIGQKLKDGLYTGNLRSSEKPFESGDFYTTKDLAGESVLFAQEGLGFFSKSIPEIGTEEGSSVLQRPDREEVYVQVGSGTNRSVAVGDEYEKAADEGKYQWSVKTEIPDLATKPNVSVSDAVLFPDQLKGKIAELEFYEAGKIEQKSAGEYGAFLSCGRGHPHVWIKFPAAGLAFFKKIAGQQRRDKAHAVYALINVSSKGIVSLEAKGLQVSGEGNNAEYRWE